MSIDVEWLLVFDNVNAIKQEDLLTDFWPPGEKGSVLITARDTASLGQFTGGKFEVLQKLASVDGVELLLKLSRKQNVKSPECGEYLLPDRL